MYLSQLILNPRSRQVRREMGNPYQQHRTIMSAFPETLPENERVLYRLDIHPRTGQMALLVQSQTAPDWSRFLEKDILLPADPFDNFDNPAVKIVNLTVQQGQYLRFRLRGNPTKRLFKDIPERKLKKGQRIGLLKEDEQRDWLDRKGKAGGFQVLSVNIVQEGMTAGRINRPNNATHKLKFLAVRFEGALQVTNPIQFLETLQKGIGSGKGLGFGLLSLARV